MSANLTMLLVGWGAFVTAWGGITLIILLFIHYAKAERPSMFLYWGAITLLFLIVVLILQVAWEVIKAAFTGAL